MAAWPLAQKFEAPAGVLPPDLAVVTVAGGRLQIRERDGSEAQAADEGQPWRHVAWLVASAAQAGFQQARRKAFVADGSGHNGRLHARFFGSFVAVLDFIPALSYVDAAATAGQRFERGWEVYQRWIAWVWRGEVKRVLEALSHRQEEVGRPQEGEAETSVASVVARRLVYLRNHQDKLRYDEYRKAGLPITSAVRAAPVKPLNRRVKGTEKFWCAAGAAAIVQLPADYRSADQPLESYFERRQRDATGQPPYRRPAA